MSLSDMDVKGYLLVLMLLAVNAVKDYDMLQREILPSPEVIDMLKKGLVDSPPTVTQKGPRIQHSKRPSITFPLARPTKDNIFAICDYSNCRPRYTKDMLPRNGFGYLHRQASAVNRLESWFTVCCSHDTQDEELTLCCAQQAWEKSLSAFCEEEFSVKTSHYYCCKKYGQAKWDCFEKEAPDPLYQPSGDEMLTVLPSTIQGFEFNPSSCQKTSVSETIPTQKMVTNPPNPSWMEQRMVLPQFQVFYREKDLSGHHVPSPRSMRPSITFPLAPPTTTNILAICQYSNQRPWHPKETLPRNGPAKLYHQASAVNQLESWYTVCCANGTQDDELTLCCAQQAWVKSLIAFCEKELHIKGTHYCCREDGPAKWDCFKNKASDMSYQPSGHEVPTVHPSTIQGFDFDSSSCHNISISEVASRVMTERAKRLKAADIGFPPGRPNFVNIKSICAFDRYPPRHLTSCLLHPGFEHLAHQVKAIDGLEKSFGQCCKESKDIQVCAEGKWKKMVDRFCKKEEKVKVNQFECCKKQRGEERYDCFNTAALNLNYSLMNFVHSDAPPNLNMLCDTYTSLQKMKRLPFGVDEMAEKCCTLVADKRSACLQLQLNNILDDACKAVNPSLTQVKHNCCMKIAKGRSECFTKLLLSNIAKAKLVNNHKKCPIIL